MENKKIEVLDCTLRDGGLCLEDKMLNTGELNEFSKDSTHKFIESIKDSKIQIIELGSIEKSEDDKRGFSIYQNIEQVSKLIPQNRESNQMYVALFRGPDTPIKEIPDWRPTFCEGLRVVLRYSELEKSLNFCEALVNKGYKVFVQPMLTMRYTSKELDYIISRTNEIKAYALYIVDSYGYMNSNDVTTLQKRFDQGLFDEIRIGFHSHNNMNLAFSNVKSFLEYYTTRSLIIDSTIMGMGQGAGNIQTELLVAHLIEHSLNDYKYASILDACEIIESFWNTNLWGYSIVNLLPAINKVAYKYSASLRHKHKLSYSQINKVLSTIPEDLGHRYTNENVNKILGIN
jgi:4-hydroxy 2-oxovalerate aldolase